EILEAVKWLSGQLKDLGQLFKKGDSLPLAAIQDGPVLAGAKRILANLGKAQAEHISLGELADTTKVFAETRFNGDGIVPAESADGAAVKQAIDDVIAVQGGVPDRSGKPGIDRPRLEAFFKEVRAVHEWQTRARDVLALGDEAATAKAAAALAAIAAKLDD